MDLSVLIAARHELFLRQTVEDVLAHAKGATEVIVVCDGDPPLEPLAVDPRLRVVILPEPIGQRAAVNLAARLSDARYLMKLDAHCAVSDGFDVALVREAAALGSDVVQIPKQYNLHVFDWQCQACWHRTYQGPTPTVCASKTCRESGPFDRIIVWDAVRRLTEAWRFDASLTFGYFGAWKDRVDKAARARQEPVPDVFETMSCLGLLFIDRAFYGVLGGLDEAFGSWGQMGQELACKAWLSGGRMVTNRRAWFSHLFRTQGRDFGFPYPLSSGQINHARMRSRDIWLSNSWPGQVRPLSWLVEHFAPVPGWHDSSGSATLDRVNTAGREFSATVTTSGGLFASRADAVSVRPDDVTARVSCPADIAACAFTVDDVGNGLKVTGVDAVTPPAMVVDFHVGIDRCDEPSVNEPMGRTSSVEDVENTVPVVVQPAAPNPASSLVVDVNIAEEAPDELGADVPNGKILSSHASASIADGWLGLEGRNQRPPGPPILQPNEQAR